MDENAVPMRKQMIPFWRAANERILSIPRCGSCRRYHFPILPDCPRCGSSELDWVPVRGHGVLDAYTVVRRAFHPAFAPRLPYIVARVALEEQDGLFLIANLLECDLAAVQAGMKVQVVFEPSQGDAKQLLPQFVPAGPSREVAP